MEFSPWKSVRREHSAENKADDAFMATTKVTQHSVLGSMFEKESGTHVTRKTWECVG